MITFKSGYKVLDKNMLVEFLTSIDHKFTPALSERVDLTFYADKLYKFAFLIVGFHNRQVTGICAFYENDHSSKTAFLSLIYIDEAYRGQGIAAKLITEMIEHLKSKSMCSVSLEVSKVNKSAIGLYEKLKFRRMNENATSLFMNLKI
jgi:ribosomal protein S18 acetylase RimI-like enzyme